MNIKKEYKQLIEEIRQDIRSVQKNFPKSYINSLSIEELLANYHPLYRNRYIERFKNIKLLKNY